MAVAGGAAAVQPGAVRACASSAAARVAKSFVDVLRDGVAAKRFLQKAVSIIQAVDFVGRISRQQHDGNIWMCVNGGLGDVYAIMRPGSNMSHRSRSI